MAIEDQIKDKKLQYDINREAGKISALLSGKIDKYEYLTGEEILPLNQQKIIERAKFTYSPLGKVFEKQTKTIEDQGEKQIKAIQDKSIKKIKKYSDYDNDYKKELLISKEREIFRDIYNDSLDQIQNANHNINYNNLNYKVMSSSDEYKFDGLKDSIHHQLQYALGSFGLTTQAQASMYVSNLIHHSAQCVLQLMMN